MSLISMTGFGRAEGSLGDWSWAVEARSVNGRNLEVRFRGPGGMDGLERAAREATQSRFQRGQVSVAVQTRRPDGERRTRVNLAVLEGYLAAGEALVASGRVRPPSLAGLLALPGVLETPEPDADRSADSAIEAAIVSSIAEALDALDAARRVEGAAIGRVLAAFLGRMANLIEAAHGESLAQPALMKARLERRFAELLGGALDPDRIAQEAAAMATRADVREEIDRLISHVASARTLLSREGGNGRRLDFLTQEFMREANTLCSKSASVALTSIGLELKATVDQFREQVQNVE